MYMYIAEYFYVDFYLGVTSPLAFSFVSYAYETVTQIIIIIIVSFLWKGIYMYMYIAEYFYVDSYRCTQLPRRWQGFPPECFPNIAWSDSWEYLLYYNLVSWYHCLICLQVGDTSKYMETIMGVKQVREKSINFKKNVAKYHIFMHKYMYKSSGNRINLYHIHINYSMQRYKHKFFKRPVLAGSHNFSHAS